MASRQGILEAEALTPRQLHYLDGLRGNAFEGPTPEEYLGWDEVTSMIVDHQATHGRDTAYLAEVLQDCELLRRFHDLVRLVPERRSQDINQQLALMEERGEMPWQR